jgi:putative endonuclease
MAFFVYILHCSDGSYYTGHTDNLERRIHEHQMGAINSCYTFKRRPLQMVFSQDFPTREEALTAEQQIKGWSRKKKEAMMRGDWAEVSRLAKSSATSVCPIPSATTTNQDCNSVRPAPVVRQAHHDRPCNSVRPISSAITNQDCNSVRPEPVEGCGCVDSGHGSTSSPRTEGELS